MKSRHFIIATFMLVGVTNCSTPKEMPVIEEKTVAVENTQVVKHSTSKEIPSKVQWTDIETAQNLIKLAENKGKIIFIDCFTDWCGWCKVMDNKTFSDTIIAKLMNYYFISVKFNTEQKEEVFFYGNTYKYQSNGNRGINTLALVLLQNKLSYPSFAFLNTDLTHKDVIAGYIEKNEFEPIIVYFGEGYDAKMPYDQFKSQYQQDIRPKVMKKIL